MAESFNTGVWPGVVHAAVTTSDTVNISPANVRALYIGTAGNAVVVDRAGTAVTYKNLSAGTILPVQATRVNATSTTAADIVAIY